MLKLKVASFFAYLVPAIRLQGRYDIPAVRNVYIYTRPLEGQRSRCRRSAGRRGQVGSRRKAGWPKDSAGSPMVFSRSRDRWARATRYELPEALFDSAIKDHSALLSAWLTQPSVQPFAISANSDEEALAFVACALDAVGTPWAGVQRPRRGPSIG